LGLGFSGAWTWSYNADGSSDFHVYADMLRDFYETVPTINKSWQQNGKECDFEYLTNVLGGTTRTQEHLTATKITFERQVRRFEVVIEKLLNGIRADTYWVKNEEKFYQDKLIEIKHYLNELDRVEAQKQIDWEWLERENRLLVGKSDTLQLFRISLDSVKSNVSINEKWLKQEKAKGDTTRIREAEEALAISKEHVKSLEKWISVTLDDSVSLERSKSAARASLESKEPWNKRTLDLLTVARKDSVKLARKKLVAWRSLTKKQTELFRTKYRLKHIKRIYPEYLAELEESLNRRLSISNSIP